MNTRETVARIELNKIKENIKILELKTNKIVLPVIKANAYGHGDQEVVDNFDSNVPFFCVSSLDEALKVKTDMDILIFSYVNPEMIKKYDKQNFIYTVTSLDWLESIKALNLKLRLHIAVNLGMNRVGIKTTEDIKVILESNHIIEGIYVHFPSNSEIIKAKKHLEVFELLVSSVEFSFKWVHLGNAPVELIKISPLVNSARFGLAIFGYRNDVPELKPALGLYSKIIHIDKLEVGDTVGYDYSYTAQEPGYFGTLSIGYADGLDMRNNLLNVYSEGKYIPIIGKICMDQSMVLIDEKSKVGDWVELIGPHRSPFEIQKVCGVTVYQTLAGLRNRIYREYHSGIVSS